MFILLLLLLLLQSSLSWDLRWLEHELFESPTPTHHRGTGRIQSTTFPTPTTTWMCVQPCINRTTSCFCSVKHRAAISSRNSRSTICTSGATPTSNIGIVRDAGHRCDRRCKSRRCLTRPSLRPLWIIFLLSIYTSLSEFLFL